MVRVEKGLLAISAGQDLPLPQPDGGVGDAPLVFAGVLADEEREVGKRHTPRLLTAV